MTGPNLRASGVKWDVRKDEPYSIYEKFNFDVPTGTGEFGTLGDSYDRYWVRMLEIQESVKILRQALKDVPSGDIHQALPKKIRPPKGSIYRRKESPRGDLGYYIVRYF